MARKKGIPKMSAKGAGGAAFDLAGIKFSSVVGEKSNYNFQPEVTEYDLWPFSTIEWVTAEGKYRARAIVQHRTTRDMVAFNSWHEDFGDAERPIDLLRHSLQGTAERPVYNIFGETIEVHTADIGGGSVVNVTEVLALIWSMTES
ncbi:MAG: hypothetical protein AB1598_04375 [Thermodesulfobacteriota bacterium]